MNMRSTKRPVQRNTGLASHDDALQALHKSPGTLETRAGRLGLPLVSHLIGVAGLLLVERQTQETTG